jgi:UDP-MurNAc hydroxylase
VLVPGYPTRSWNAASRALGFDKSSARSTARRWHSAPLRIAIHIETSITDGPGGDSALVVSDGTARLVNQNDCRTDDLDALRAHGPVDLHWLQYSGAIWYPMVYDEPPERMRELVDAKVASQFARAMRYVEAIDAAPWWRAPAHPRFWTRSCSAST